MKKIITVLAITAFMSGCASIIKGNNQNVNISTSNGKQAEAIVSTASGQQTVTLPTSVSVKTDNKDIVVTVKESNCNNSSTAVVPSRLHPWFWGNIITGGLFGSTTDSVSGAMWRYDESVIVNVTEKEQCKIK